MKVQLYKATIHDKLTNPERPRDEETTGSEEKIERIYKAVYPQVFFEEQEDGRILVFRSEDEASSPANSIGEVVKGEVVDIEV
jgi:hypothetical protein